MDLKSFLSPGGELFLRPQVQTGQLIINGESYTVLSLLILCCCFLVGEKKLRYNEWSANKKEKCL